MILNLGWEEDLKFKLRFLELMFLLTTILIATKSSIGSAFGSGLLVFLVFGSLYYFILANGIIDNNLTVPVGFITGFSLSAVFSSVFVSLETLSFTEGLIYWIILGSIFSLGMLPKKALMDIVGKFR